MFQLCANVNIFSSVLLVTARFSFFLLLSFFISFHFLVISFHFLSRLAWDDFSWYNFPAGEGEAQEEGDTDNAALMALVDVTSPGNTPRSNGSSHDLHDQARNTMATTDENGRSRKHAC